MNTQHVFNAIDDDEQEHLKAYWAQKQPRLEKHLLSYRPEDRELRLTVSGVWKDPGHRQYEVQAVLHLPTGTLAARAVNANSQAALDRVADELAVEIKKHKERVRKDFLHKRKARSRAGLSAAVAALRDDVDRGNRANFVRLIRPNLDFLRSYARRELRKLELHGLLHRGEVTEDDLLDEVVVRAWQRFANRPRGLSLDLWLTQLLHEELQRTIEQEPRHHASLEEPPKQDTTDATSRTGDDDNWWADLLGEEEQYTLGDLIPDLEATDAWDRFEAQEQRDRLLSAVSSLPPTQQQAFFLHALEDYDTSEIARLQNRPESEVKADIEAARQTLRKRLMADGLVQGKDEAATAAHAATPG